MANVFANANLTVVPGNKPKEVARKIDVMSDQMAAKMCLQRRELEEKQRQEEILRESAERKAEQRVKDEAVIARQVFQARVQNAIREFPHKAKTEVFKKVLTECYAKSLILEESFVNSHMGNLAKVVSDYVDSNGGFKLLENAVMKTNSLFLRKMKAVCEKTAKEITSRKTEELKKTEPTETIEFDMTTEEEKSFDANKTEIPPDEIAELVKDKVLTVVKDEKERQAKEDELRADIESELNDSEDVTDIETAKEAVENIFIRKSPIDHATLFGALLRNSCNEVIIESLDNEIRDVDTTEDDISNFAPGSDDTINGDAMDSDRLSYDSADSDSEVKRDAIPMEAAMYEAIAQYTLMETLYTLKLADYSYDDIRHMSDKLIRPIKK